MLVHEGARLVQRAQDEKRGAGGGHHAQHAPQARLVSGAPQVQPCAAGIRAQRLVGALHGAVRARAQGAFRALPPGKVRPVGRVHQHGHVRARQGFDQAEEVGPGDEDGVAGDFLRGRGHVRPGGQEHRFHVGEYAGGLRRVVGVAAHQQPPARPDIGQHHGEDTRRGAAGHEDGRPRPRRSRQQALGLGNARKRGVEVVGVGKLGHVQRRGHGLQPALVARHVEARFSLRRFEHIVDGPHDRPPL